MSDGKSKKSLSFSRSSRETLYSISEENDVENRHSQAEDSTTNNKSTEDEIDKSRPTTSDPTAETRTSHKSKSSDGKSEEKSLKANSKTGSVQSISKNDSQPSSLKSVKSASVADENAKDDETEFEIDASSSRKGSKHGSNGVDLDEGGETEPGLEDLSADKESQEEEKSFVFEEEDHESGTRESSDIANEEQIDMESSAEGAVDSTTGVEEDEIDRRTITSDRGSKAPTIGDESQEDHSIPPISVDRKSESLSLQTRISIDAVEGMTKEKRGSDETVLSVRPMRNTLRSVLSKLEEVGPKCSWVRMSVYDPRRMDYHKKRRIPTYQLDPLTQFDPDAVHKMLASIVTAAMGQMPIYEENAASQLANNTAVAIRTAVKSLLYDRRKVAVMVYVGEKRYQGMHVDMRPLWDKDRDRITTYCDNSTSSTYFMLAMCCGIYKD